MVEIPDRFKKAADKIQGNLYAVQVSETSYKSDYNPCSDYEDNCYIGYRYKKNPNHGNNWYQLGKDEKWATIMQQLYCDSGIHRSIIDAKVNMIVGDHLDFQIPNVLCKKDEDGFYQREKLDLSDSAKEDLLEEGELWRKNVMLDPYQEKAALQYAIYGGYYGLGRYNLNENVETYLRNIYVEDFNNMRQSTDREFIDNKFQSKKHFQSRKFDKKSGRKFFTDYKKYIENLEKNQIATAVIKVDDGSIYKDKDFGIRSKFVAKENAIRKIYSSPDYETRKALNYMMIDFLISQHDFNGLSNNFAVEYFVIRYRMKKITTEEENAEKKKDIKMMQNHKGVDGSIVGMMWAEPYIDPTGKVQTPPPIQVIPIPRDNSHDRFNIMREERSIAILNAHGVITPEIVGIPNLLKSSFSSQADMLVAALEQFYFNRIRPVQKLIEEDINERLLLDGLSLIVKTKKSLPIFKAFTDKILLEIFGKDELRAMVGSSKMSEEVREELAQRLMKNVTNREESNQ